MAGQVEHVPVGRAREPVAAAMVLDAMRQLGVLLTAAWSRRPIRPLADEAVRPLPGDELVADAKVRWNHAVTIRARPAEIWPWLVQMGCQRAGWYSYDGLDNGGVRSADRVVPELQQVQVGDVLPDGARGRRHIRRPDGRAGAGTRARRRSSAASAGKHPRSSTSPRAPSAGSTPAGRQLKHARRKPGGIVAVAIARELAGYCWKIATCPTALEPTPTPTTRRRLTNSR
jgi:hypothetical protein